MALTVHVVLGQPRKDGVPQGVPEVTVRQLLPLRQPVRRPGAPGAAAGRGRGDRQRGKGRAGERPSAKGKRKNRQQGRRRRRPARAPHPLPQGTDARNVKTTRIVQQALQRLLWPPPGRSLPPQQLVCGEEHAQPAERLQQGRPVGECVVSGPGLLSTFALPGRCWPSQHGLQLRPRSPPNI